MKSLLLAAAGIVTATFALFSSVLNTLAPPVSRLTVAQQAGIASLGGLAIILVLLAIAPKTPSARQLRSAGFTGFVVGLIGFLALFQLMEEVDAHQYMARPNRESREGEFPAIHGVLKPFALAQLKDMSLEQAIDNSGGLAVVIANETFWTRESQLHVERKLTAWYVGSVTAVLLGIFGLVVVLSNAYAARRRRARAN